MLKPGLDATFTLAQYPGRKFKATFLTTANAFNPQTRTVVTELVAQNPDHLLWPGTYATVQFVVPTNKNVGRTSCGRKSPPPAACASC